MEHEGRNHSFLVKVTLPCNVSYLSHHSMCQMAVMSYQTSYVLNQVITYNFMSCRVIYHHCKCWKTIQYHECHIVLYVTSCHICVIPFIICIISSSVVSCHVVSCLDVYSTFIANIVLSYLTIHVWYDVTIQCLL